MTSNDEKGRWVRDTDVHPMTNMWGRKWRVAHLDGSVTTGVYRGVDGGPPYPPAAEWFFPEEQA